MASSRSTEAGIARMISEKPLVAAPRDHYTLRPNTQSVPFFAGARVLNRSGRDNGVVGVGAIFIWGTLAARPERADLTAPIVFTAVGAGIAGLGLVDETSAPRVSSRWSRLPWSGCSSPTRRWYASTISPMISADTSGCSVSA